MSNRPVSVCAPIKDYSLLYKAKWSNIMNGFSMKPNNVFWPLLTDEASVVSASLRMVR